MVQKYHPGTLMIAEESTAWPQVSKPSHVGGLGFNFKWNMGWMHDILEYMSKDPVYRKYDHNKLTFSIWYAFSENFILPLSHDEIVYGKGSLINKMPGDAWQRFANLRLLYGYMFAHPGKKLLFMGDDFGQWNEWWHESGLDWHLLEDDLHRELHHYVRDLNHFYRAHPALHNDQSFDSFQWIDFRDSDNSVIAFYRRNAGEEIMFIFNFTPMPRFDYRLGVEKAGSYAEIFNSDARMFGGSNLGNLGNSQTIDMPWQGKPYTLILQLPPLAMTVFQFQKPDIVD